MMTWLRMYLLMVGILIIGCITMVIGAHMGHVGVFQTGRLIIGCWAGFMFMIILGHGIMTLSRWIVNE